MDDWRDTVHSTLDILAILRASGLSGYDQVLVCLVGLGHDRRDVCDLLHLSPAGYTYAMRRARERMASARQRMELTNGLGSVRHDRSL